MPHLNVGHLYLKRSPSLFTNLHMDTRFSRTHRDVWCFHRHHGATRCWPLRLLLPSSPCRLSYMYTKRDTTGLKQLFREIQCTVETQIVPIIFFCLPSSVSFIYIPIEQYTDAQVSVFFRRKLRATKMDALLINALS